MYLGNLLFVEADWLAFAFREIDHRIAYVLQPDSKGLNTGSPVFILDREDAARQMVLFGHVSSYTERTTLIDSWQWLGHRTGFLTEQEFFEWVRTRLHLSPASEVDVMSFTYLTSITPAVTLGSVGIEVSCDKVIHELTPEEVLAVLRVLPASARTDWTERVIARNNELS